MSGRTKILIYRIADWTLWIAAVAGAMAMFLLMPEIGAWEIVAGIGFVVLLALRFPAAVHECGHLLAAAICGMGVHSSTVSYFNFSRDGVRFVGLYGGAGESELIPKNGKHVARKLLFCTAGGPVFNLLTGGVLLALYLALPAHAALLFCGMNALFLLGEGLRSLVPAELPEGMTDGARFLSVAKKDAQGQVLLAVLTAEGILYGEPFDAVPYGLLFETPVIREDEPSFSALLELRMLWHLNRGEREEAKAVLGRISSISEGEGDTSLAEQFAPCCDGEPPLEGEQSLLFGVRELKEKLSAK